MFILKFAAWLVAVVVVLVLIINGLVRVIAGTLADNRLSSLGKPPSGVPLAVHFGKSIFLTGIPCFFLGILAAFGVRYLTLEYVSAHWLYRAVLVFLAYGMSPKAVGRGGTLTGEIGQYFEFVASNTLSSGVLVTLLVLEAVAIVRWALA